MPPALDPPSVECSTELRWVLWRAFAPEELGLDPPPDVDAAVELLWRFDLATRIASRHTAERIRGELGRRRGVDLAFLRHSELRREAERLEFSRDVARIAAGRLMPIVVLKAGALRLSGASRPGSRPATDIDILVPSDRVQELAQALRSAGYAEHEPIPALQGRHHIPPFVDARGYWIEVHSRIPGVRVPATRRFLTFDEMRTEGLLREAEELGPTAWLPADELLVAHAIAHGLRQHRYGPRKYSQFKMVSDLIDLGVGDVGAQQVREAHRWLAHDLAEEETGSLGRLCGRLRRGDEGLWADLESPEGRLLRHMVAGVLDEQYAGALGRRAVLHPLVEGSRAPRICRSLMAMAAPGLRPFVWRIRGWRRRLAESEGGGKARRAFASVRRALRKVVYVDGSLLFELDLTREGSVRNAAAIQDLAPFVVREVSREDLESLVGQAPDEVDRVAPDGWRCLAAIDGQRAASYVFLRRPPAGPHLFRGWTDPGYRGRRLLPGLMLAFASELRAQGERRVTGGARLGNRPSVRAQRAAGFCVVRQRRDVVVFGVWLRRSAGRARSALRKLAESGRGSARE